MKIAFNVALVGCLLVVTMVQAIDAKIATSFTESSTRDSGDETPVMLPPDIKAIHGRISMNDNKDCFQYVVEKKQTAVNISFTTNFTVPKKGLEAFGRNAAEFTIYNTTGHLQTSLLKMFSCNVFPTQVRCASNLAVLPSGVNIICMENQYPDKNFTVDYNIILSPSTRANEYWESQEGDASEMAEIPLVQPIPSLAFPRTIPRGKNSITGALSSPDGISGDLIDCYEYKLSKAANVTVITTYQPEKPREAFVMAFVNGIDLFSTSCPARITKTLSDSATCDTYPFHKGKNYICMVNYPSPDVDNNFMYNFKLSVVSA